MADIQATAIGLAGRIGPLGATVAGGDEFSVSEGDTLLFYNGHTASVTANLVAVAATAPVVGGFPAVVANKSFVIPAGETAIVPISGQNMGAYINQTTKKVAVTYTGHNVALKAMIIRKG